VSPRAAPKTRGLGMPDRRYRVLAEKFSLNAKRFPKSSKSFHCRAFVFAS